MMMMNGNGHWRRIVSQMFIISRDDSKIKNKMSMGVLALGASLTHYSTKDSEIATENEEENLKMKDVNSSNVMGQPTEPEDEDPETQRKRRRRGEEQKERRMMGKLYSPKLLLEFCNSKSEIVRMQAAKSLAFLSEEGFTAAKMGSMGGFEAIWVLTHSPDFISSHKLQLYLAQTLWNLVHFAPGSFLFPFIFLLL